MIVYQLACQQEHHFEGWFASSEACAQQAADGLLECPVCASLQVRKLPAAPHVHTSGEAPAEAPAQLHALVLGRLRKYILANTEDVGRKFPEIARRIHYKEEDARGIRGQVTREEAEALHEEGIDTLVVAPEAVPPGEIH